MVERDRETDKEGVVQLAVCMCVCERWRMGADVGGQGMGVQADTTHS